MTARLASVCLLAACLDTQELTEPPIITSRVEYKDLALRVPRRLDLLFVIDGSPAMRAHRETVEANAPNFIHVLNTIEGGLPSVQIAVISSDLGTSGRDGVPGADLPGEGACGSTGDDGRFRTTNAISGRFLVDRQFADRSRERNYTGLLHEVFPALARVGDSRCAFSQPLEAMRRALLEPQHGGFLRDDADLAVIFITAQDDCSFGRAAFLDDVALAPIDTSRCYTRADELVPIDTYVTLLRSLKRDPSRITVSGVFGPTAPIELRVEDGRVVVAPSCSYERGEALPSPRLQLLLDQFPNRNTTTSICQQDLSGGLQLFSGLPSHRFSDPCFSGVLADADPLAPGRQEDCTVWYEFPPFGHVQEQLLERCTSAHSTACWTIATDLARCPKTGDFIKIETGPVELPDTHAHVECVTQ